MKIKHAAALKGAESLIGAKIAEIAGRSGAHPLAGVDLDNLSFSEPHDVYVAQLKDVASGALDARKTGSRFLLVEGGRAVADIEFDTQSAFAGLHQGPFVAATVKGLMCAVANQQYAAEYELRFLKIPALYLVCLWFVNGAEQVFMPLEPAPHGIEACRLYSEKDLLNAIVPLAQATSVAHN
jgi:hypothetical protein